MALGLLLPLVVGVETGYRGFDLDPGVFVTTDEILCCNDLHLYFPMCKDRWLVAKTEREEMKHLKYFPHPLVGAFNLTNVFWMEGGRQAV